MNRRFSKFIISSFLGLGIDLLVFQIMVYFNSSALLANLCSSILAVGVLYFLVSRFTFAGKGSYIAALIFYFWYFAIIIFFSLVIELVSSSLDIQPILIKVLTIPISFLLNYLFSIFVFKRFLL